MAASRIVLPVNEAVYRKFTGVKDDGVGKQACWEKHAFFQRLLSISTTNHDDASLACQKRLFRALSPEFVTWVGGNGPPSTRRGRIRCEKGQQINPRQINHPAPPGGLKLINKFPTNVTNSFEEAIKFLQFFFRWKLFYNQLKRRFRSKYRC